MTMVIGAWIAMLLASNVSLIIWRVVLRRDIPGWHLPVRIALLIALLVITLAWPRMRPLHGYILALVALSIGNWIGDLVKQTPAWTTWARSAPEHLQVLADALLKLLPVGLMVLTLVGSGIGRRTLFLTRGTLNAPTTLPGLGGAPWTYVGLVGTALFAIPLALQLSARSHPNFQLLNRAVAALPLALLFGLINAGGEEFRFRSVLLARLLPALGRTQALWLTSTHFGLGHWFGHPSGATGAVMTALAGVVLATSMLDTGGIAWAWFMHGVQDVLLYVILVLGSH